MAEESEEPSDGMTQPSREKPPWWKKLSQTCKAAWRWCKAAWRQCKEWMGGFPLFGAIAVWAFLGIIAFLLAVWCLGGVLVWQLKLDPEKSGGKHRQDCPDPCRRRGRGGLPGDQVPGTAAGRTG